RSDRAGRFHGRQPAGRPVVLRPGVQRTEAARARLQLRAGDARAAAAGAHAAAGGRDDFRRRKHAMSDRHETRRRFMAHFASVGLGATLAPGIVWARMQDAGTQTITLEMITEALKLSGLEFTEAERK